MNATGLSVLLVLEPGIDTWSIEGALPAGTRIQTATFDDAAGPGTAPGSDVMIVGVAHEAEGRSAGSSRRGNGSPTGRSSSSTRGARTGSSSGRSRSARTI